MCATRNTETSNGPLARFFKGVFTTIFCFLLPGLLSTQLTAAPYQQATGTEGLVSIESEGFDTNVSKSGKSWTNNYPSGYSGTGALVASPNTGTNNNTGYATNSPRLDYVVNFVKTGVHYVWVRGAGQTGNDDSLHVGLDGIALSSSNRISNFSTGLSWTNTKMGGTVVTINVATVGKHTLNVWMREDGTVFDKIVLTTNRAFSPGYKGPLASTRSTTGSVSYVPIVTLSTNKLNLGSQDVGGISAPSSVKLTNSGTAPLYISSITTSSGFIQANNCNDNLSIGGSCVINVEFVPTSTGTITGSLTINSNAESSNAVNLVGTGTDGSQPLSSLTPSGPIVINGERDVVISGLRISNPNGSCIVVKKNALRITIENSEIGPCRDMGVSILNSKNVTVRNSYIHDTGDVGVQVEQTSIVEVSGNQIDRTMTGVHALGGQQVNVDSNRFHTVNGSYAINKLNAFIQFSWVSGYGNRINNNVMVTKLGTTDVGDDINLWKSHGKPDDPIQVNNNVIVGSGPRKNGSGILLGDGGSSYAIAKGNILVNPGATGVGVAGGNNNALVDNTIYSTRLDWSNVGLYVWDQYNLNCHNITVRGNRVNWTKKDGTVQGAWNGGNCGAIKGWSDNDLRAPIGPDIAEGLY